MINRDGVINRGGKGEDAEERNFYPKVPCLGAKGTLLQLSRSNSALRY